MQATASISIDDHSSQTRRREKEEGVNCIASIQEKPIVEVIVYCEKTDEASEEEDDNDDDYEARRLKNIEENQK